jgi:hypothetical protein
MARIHHATLAKAKKFQITLTLEDNDVVATSKDGKRLASGLQGNKVLEEAITKLTGHPAKKSTVRKLDFQPVAKKRKSGTPSMVDADEAGEEPSDEELDETGEESEALADQGDEESEADIRRSGVKHKYKERYKPFGGKCGDQLSFDISDHVSYVDQDGKTKVDKAALMRFAKANDAWRPVYGTLTTKSGAWNGGMARMNVSNILRGKAHRAEKDKVKFEIDWA